MLGFGKEAVRVKVKKCEGKLQPELRKFSVDPQITSLEVLLSILIKAFDIKSDFTLLYRAQDDFGQEVYLPVLSDWDLEAAFLKSHNIASSNNAEPFLQLRVDMKPFSVTSEDWEPPNIPIQEANLIYKDHVVQPAHLIDKQEPSTGLQGLFMNQVGRTLTMVTKALNLHDDPDSPPRQPLNDMEFRSFLNAAGQINNPIKLKEVIYCGGIEPSLRKVVWKHILNVYPDGMTGKERMDFIKLKANEYYVLRTKWKDCIQKGKVNTTITYVTSMVRKDVLRTDRHHKFYAGSDDNQNIASLFNILTTYALNHPTVSYCQGMSDLASPLLMTMGDEAHAYVCLCALMARLHPNFLLDGQAMTLKFTHLSEALQLYDPEFYAYLKAQQADDLLFCYRWLLLEMKREFAFDDALRMLEVLWASLPQKYNEDLSLKEQEFDPDVESGEVSLPISPLIKTPRENAYTKVCAIRRQSSSFTLANVKNTTVKPQKNNSLDENISNGGDSMLKKTKEFQSLDDAKIRMQRSFRSNEHIDEVKTYNSQLGKSSPKISMLRKCNDSKKQDKIWSSTGNLTKETPLGSQIKLLKDRISKDEIKCNYLANTSVSVPDKPVKVIRNLNEFLNLANHNKSAKKVNVTLSENSISNIDRSSQNSIDSETNEYKKNKRKNISASIDSSPDDSQDYYPMTTSITRELRLELEHLDRQVFGTSYNDNKELCDDLSSSSSSSEYNKKPDSENSTNEHNTEIKDTEPVDRNIDDVFLWENPLHSNKTTVQTAVSSPLTPDEQSDIDNDAENLERKEDSERTIELVKKYSTLNITDCDNSNEHSKNSNDQTRSGSSQNNSLKSQKFFSSMSQELENAKRNCETMLNKPTNFHSMAATINTFQKKYDAFKSPVQSSVAMNVNSDGKYTIANLPPPSVFGGGNPFLMFLCLTVLLQHRDYIIRNRMDYNELAMHFDKMVRKHNVNRVLNQARQMYTLYLKNQTQKNSHVST